MKSKQEVLHVNEVNYSLRAQPPASPITAEGGEMLPGEHYTFSHKMSPLFLIRGGKKTRKKEVWGTQGQSHTRKGCKLHKGLACATTRLSFPLKEWRLQLNWLAMWPLF